MKFPRYLALFLCLIVACSEEKSAQHFELVIRVPWDNGFVVYTLEDTSLIVQRVPGGNETIKESILFRTTIKDNDSLALINFLDVKAYDCNEQHALLASGITFKNDSGIVQISPDINHPKEIDLAARIINFYVPDMYNLLFIDMQQAIEPDGKMRL